jgi:hypothetical protein
MPPFKEIVYVEAGGRARPEDDEARRQLPDRRRGGGESGKWIGGLAWTSSK